MFYKMICGLLINLIYISPLFAQSSLQYKITLNPSSQHAKVSLTLPDNRKSEPLILYSPSKQRQLSTQVENVRCNRQGTLLENAKGWIVPSHCKEITWDIRLHSDSTDKIDLAKQENLSLGKPRWWIISTGTGLLNIEGEKKQLN